MFGKTKKDEPSDLEKAIQFLRSYTKLWADLFQFFSDKIEEGSVNAQQEEEFFKIITILSTRHFELTNRAADDLKDSENIVKFLGTLVSLQHLQTVSEVEFSSTQVRWHEIFIGLNKALGKLVQKLPAPAETKPAATQAPANA